MLATSPKPRKLETFSHREVFRHRHEVVPILDRISAEMARCGYSNQEQFGLRLALEEAMVNAVRHGHRDDPTKQAHVRYSVTPDRILAQVEDQGPGFDPNTIPDPLDPENLGRDHGRGLLLIRFYMTWVRFNGRGNCITMCKSRR